MAICCHSCMLCITKIFKEKKQNKTKKWCENEWYQVPCSLKVHANVVCYKVCLACEKLENRLVSTGLPNSSIYYTKGQCTCFTRANTVVFIYFMWCSTCWFTTTNGAVNSACAFTEAHKVQPLPPLQKHLHFHCTFISIAHF